MRAPASPSAACPEERLARLQDERDFLLSSIEDLEAERAAGDLGEEDYARLRSGYVARAAETLRAIAALEASTAERAPRPTAPSAWARLRLFLGRRRTRRVLGTIAVACVLGIVAITAAHFAGVRLPGEVATGSIELPAGASVQSELAAAATLDDEGHLRQAISIYDTILRAHPRQAEALAYRGWVLRLTGVAGHAKALVAAGDAGLSAAVRLDPTSAPARALYGVALFEDEGRSTAALGQFRAALADHPTRQLLKLTGRTMAAAFVQTHTRLPGALLPYRPR